MMGRQKLVVQRQPKIAQHEGGYFVRINIKDKPGTMASVASRMAQQGISLKSIIQDEGGHPKSKNVQQVIIVTHKCAENGLQKAIQNINKDQKLTGKSQINRIKKIR